MPSYITRRINFVLQLIVQHCQSQTEQSPWFIQYVIVYDVDFGSSYSVDSIKRTVHLTFHGLFFLLKVLFFWKIENSTFNRDSTKFICLENFQYLLQYVFEFKKFVLNLHIYIGTYLCTCKYHPLETTYLLCMHTNVMYIVQNWKQYS